MKTQRHTDNCPVKMEAEISVMDLQEKQQQECMGLPQQLERGMEQMVRLNTLSLRSNPPNTLISHYKPPKREKNLFFLASLST